ncbi:ADP-dependent NAD(P)H-hydrate dehydratase [Microbacterium flavum]|uniref:ADP-dependent NAD(P)H-hydrate dehydratase n=1 Tax=Microbacterium flavum TaxID=415216 RepID=UPI0024AC8ACE|nr:ADP/ATP-dependent (S)-NAD(P)H-hydrate dehydratase [Microbacterium flavum]
MTPDARSWTVAEAAAHLRRPTAADDKYSRGVVGVRTGSDRYPGAAVLGVEAAHRAGAGMVRYLGPDRATDLVLARRPETVAADGRVQAWVIGSGTDAAHRAPHETAALGALLAGEVPVVVDAGALDLVPRRSRQAPVVVTPHGSEHARLRRDAGLAEASGDRVRDAADTAAALGVAVLLKGAETIVATPSGWSRVVTAPTSWLAAAGTGDVLGGVLGAVVAAASAERTLDAEDLGPLAATASLVHGRAAARASALRGGGPITALDVAGAVPLVIGELLSADAGDAAAQRTE